MRVVTPGYAVIRRFVRFWIYYYFRKLRVENLDKVPWDKPVLLAPNHQNAFLDSLVILVEPRKQLFYLARADIFESKIVRWLLSVIHMLPIYRLRDGIDQLDRNEKIFALCYEILEKGGPLLIHPEGNCIPKKRIRRVKKGFARIAFGAMEARAWEMDLQIVPVGINYERHLEADSDVLVRFGEAIPIKEYKEAYDEHDNRAMRELADDIEEELREITINLDHKKTQKVSEHLIQLYRPEDEEIDYTRSAYSYSHPKRYHLNKQLTEKLKEIAGHEPETIERLEQQTTRYSNRLRKWNIPHLLIRQQGPSISVLLLQTLAAILTFPVYLYGAINNIIPYLLPDYVTKKYIRERQFISSFRFAVGLFTMMPLIFIQPLVFWAITGWGWGALGYAASLPVSAYYLKIYRVLTEKIRTGWRFSWYSWRKPKLIHRLLMEDEAIHKEVDRLMEKS